MYRPICQFTDSSVSSYVNQNILVTYFDYFDGPSDSGLNGRVRRGETFT